MTNGVQVDVSVKDQPKVSFYGVGEERADVLEALDGFKGREAPLRKYPASEPGQ